MHRSPYISMAHCPHDRGQVSSARQNPRAVVMPRAVQNQLFWKSSVISGFSKQVADRPQVPGCGSLGREYPTVCSRSTALLQNFEDAPTHWNEPRSFWRFAIWDEDQPVLPVQIFQDDADQSRFRPMRSCQMRSSWTARFWDECNDWSVVLRRRSCGMRATQKLSSS